MRKLITNQKITKYTSICFLKSFFKKRLVAKYGCLPESNVTQLRTTKYVSVCQIQGRFKKTLKIFHFSRHLIRANTHKHNFSSLTSNV